MTIEDFAKQLVAMGEDTHETEVVEVEEDVPTEEEYQNDVCDAFYRITGIRLGETKTSFYY